MKRRILLALLATAIIGLGAPAAVAIFRSQTGYRDAQELLAHQLWPQARERLTSYLWLHPGDAQARLLMAEALVKDDSLPTAEAASQAIQCLAQIPDSSPHAAEARFREGGSYFLILQQPHRAERLLRRAIDLGAGLPAYQLLWTLLNFTGRSEQTEEIFWRVYELSPEDQQPAVLREWYLSQFSPLTAYEYLDRRLHILGPQEEPSRTTESRRYIRFREIEPQSPASHAAVAQWCQQEGDPDFALRVLEPAFKDLPPASADPFFLSVSIATHLDLGQFNEAQACFRRWPAADRGHAYWKWRAAILDDVEGLHDEALAAYDRALELWPGPVDWSLLHRKAGCLARLRKVEEAAAAKERAAQLQALMKPEAHERRMAALALLNDPQRLNEVAQFYRELGRDREADQWQKHLKRLAAHLAEAH